MKTLVLNARSKEDHEEALSKAKVIIRILEMDADVDYKITCLYSNKNNYKGFEIRRVKSRSLLVSYDSNSQKVTRWHRGKQIG